MIYISPAITEKTSKLAENNQVAFYISQDLNKIEIKKFLKSTFDVDATSVNVMNVKGKKVRRGRIVGKKNDRKKVIATLKEGQTIDFTQQKG